MSKQGGRRAPALPFVPMTYPTQCAGHVTILVTDVASCRAISSIRSRHAFTLSLDPTTSTLRALRPGTYRGPRHPTHL
jgi:hypothetical protein